MPDITISRNGIKKLLENIKPEKAAGPDEIHARALKMLAEPISSILEVIFSKSLETGEIPEDWRLANVTPVFKKGEKFKASNYRPVSLTCIACKIMEHVITSNIMQHLDSNNILYKWQHGFRSKLSTETQLCTFVDEIAKSMQNNTQTDAIILDFEKAFDKVAHQRLIHKSDYYGIRGKTLKWIEAFLGNRKQRVVVDGEQSSYLDVESGVPQGTVLGPALFLIYINDMPDTVKSSIQLFADNAILYRQIESTAD